MALNFGFYKNIPSYEGGNSNTYVKTAYLMTGTYTEVVGAAVAGSVLSMYDRDITSYYNLADNTNATYKVQWEFESQIEFKNIYISANLGGRTGQTATLSTSVNGTDWTAQDTFPSTAGISIQPLLASSVKCRFVKVELPTIGGDMSARVYLAEAVI